MGKKSRRDRAAYGPLRPPGSQTVGQTARGSRRGTTAGRFDDDVQPARNEPSAQPKPTVAEAEAELRAAIAAIPPSPDNNVVKVSEHPRCVRAIVALSFAVTLDDDDHSNFSAYFELATTALECSGDVETNEIIKAIKRWPRIRKYWRRIRRRICWGCGKEYDLSEPRIWVCGGCGEARYCNAACQRAHWPKHKLPCLKTWQEKATKRELQGESWAKLRKDFLELYPSRDG